MHQPSFFLPCYLIYVGLHQFCIGHLEQVLDLVVQLIGNSTRAGHVSDYLQDNLHSHPISERIAYRISAFVSRCLQPRFTELYILRFMAACLSHLHALPPCNIELSLLWTQPFEGVLYQVYIETRLSCLGLREH